MLTNHNYATHCSVITVLICYAQLRDYNTNTLCMQLQCQYAVHWRIDLLSLLLLLRISKPRLVQVGLNTIVENHTRAQTHTCMNGAYCYFKRLCPVVISNSIYVSEYWYRYPVLKLSSMSRCNALILALIVKNSFNSTYCQCSIVTGTSD